MQEFGIEPSSSTNKHISYEHPKQLDNKKKSEVELEFNIKIFQMLKSPKLKTHMTNLKFKKITIRQ